VQIMPVPELLFKIDIFMDQWGLGWRVLKEHATLLR